MVIYSKYFFKFSTVYPLKPVLNFYFSKNTFSININTPSFSQCVFKKVDFSSYGNLFEEIVYDLNSISER